MYTSIELSRVRGRHPVIALLAASVLGCSHPGLTSSVVPAPGGEKLVAEGLILPPVNVDSNTTDLMRVYLPVKIRGKAMTVKADLGAYNGFSAGTRDSTLIGPGIPAENLVIRSSMGTYIDSLEIGTEVEHGVRFTREDDYTPPPPGMPPSAGTLGNEVLSHYDVVLDGPAGRIRLYSPQYVSPGSATKAGASRSERPAFLPPGFKQEDCVPMEGPEEGVLITLHANGHVVRGILDTGSWPTNMNMVAAQTLGFTDTNPNVHPYHARWFLNGVQTHSAVAAGAITLSLGTQRLTSVPVFIFDRITVPGTGDEPVLNIGMEAIQDRVLFVSYSTKQVCIGEHK